MSLTTDRPDLDDLDGGLASSLVRNAQGHRLATAPEPVRINVYVILTADDYAAFGDDPAALESAIAARLEELEADGGTVRPRVLGVDVEA